VVITEKGETISEAERRGQRSVRNPNNIDAETRAASEVSTCFQRDGA